jgi:hypothetical protein
VRYLLDHSLRDGERCSVAQRPEVRRWISRSRLNANAAAERGLDPADPRRRQQRDLFRESAAKAAAKLPHLLAEPDDTEHLNGPGHAERERSAIAWLHGHRQRDGE